MKTTLLLLVAVFNLLFLSTRVSAQYSARNLTRRIVPQPGGPGVAPNQQQKRTPAPTPAPATPPTPAPTEPTPAQTPVVRRPTPVPVVTRPVDPEKEKAAQEKADQKAVEFEKQRADQDYGWAQYALGVRYMTGKGVEKDPEQARKWLVKASKNGESQAAKKLAELDKERSEPAEPDAASEKSAKGGNSAKAVSPEQSASDSKIEKK